jgi:uncharacterized protein (UPF0276 family)
VIGIGLKSQHVADLLAGPPVLDFVEVHAENYMVRGGPFLVHLERVRQRHALSIHGVGLSIGGDAPLDMAHLDRLAALVSRFEPGWFSEHLAWSSHGGHFFNDLLPVPYDERTLHRVCDHIDQVQAHLGRRMLLENPSTYVEYEASTIDEAAFLREVVRRTGCGLLLDVNNAYVSAVNHGRDAQSYIDALPLQVASEIHLAGFLEDRDAAGDRLLIDAHGSPVDEAVWALYRDVLDRVGPVPTLIERDNNVPSLDTLVAEARQAQRWLGDAVPRHPAAAAA